MNRFDELTSGDVILYSGKHPLHLRQKNVTGCRWSQVGLVLRLPNNPFAFIFESTKLSSCCDSIIGEIVHGVQIARLDDRIDNFEGKVAVRQIWPRLSKSSMLKLCCFVQEVHGRPFNASKWTAARAFRRRNAPHDGSSFFCSELVAEAFQRIGLLPMPPSGVSSNNYIPADFSSEYPSSILTLPIGYCLSTERLLPPATSI